MLDGIKLTLDTQLSNGNIDIKKIAKIIKYSQ